MDEVTLNIIAPIDFHHHLRDESESESGTGLLSMVTKAAARQFNKLIVMVNKLSF